MILKELMQHFFILYGRRDRIYLPSLEKRINYLGSGIGDLQDAIRKEAQAMSMGDALARVVRRVFCIAEHFKDLDFIGTMTKKYPLTKCTYCGNTPCNCPSTRPKVKLEKGISSEQQQWDLSKWCKSFNILYGRKNKLKGIENLLNRLFKEATELQLLLLQVESGQSKSSLEEVEEEFLLELADAFAWSIAVANFLDIDLVEEVWKKYGAGCGHCCRVRCRCNSVIFDQKRYS
jgi:NTP pyrophosphatase (non-canonical NTP hydrolase)